MSPICVFIQSIRDGLVSHCTYDRRVVVHEQKVFLFVSVYLFKSYLSVELSEVFCSPCLAVRDA